MVGVKGMFCGEPPLAHSCKGKQSMQAEASVTSTAAGCSPISQAGRAIPWAWPHPRPCQCSLSISDTGFALQQSPLVLWVGEDEETPS